MPDTNIRANMSVGMDISDVLGSIKAIQGAFNGLKLPANLTGDTVKEFQKLQESISKYQDLMKKNPKDFTKGDVKNLEKLANDIDKSMTKLSDSFKGLSNQKVYLDADISKIKAAEDEINKIKSDIQTKLSEIKIDFKVGKKTSSQGFDDIFSGIEKAVSRSSTLKTAMGRMMADFGIGDMTKAISQLDGIEAHATKLTGTTKNLLNTFRELGLINFNGTAEDFLKLENGTKAADALHKAFDGIRSALAQANPEVADLVKKLETATQGKLDAEAVGAKNYADAMGNLAAKTEQAQQAQRALTSSNNQFVQSTMAATKQVEQLQQSTQYFFSLRNMINLLKRGVREAVESVKELDAVMTQTAVVTNFSVGDMWEKLPEYTANANALGASVKDMYEATTLYYQQGLNTEQSMSIAAETMKMARIGGLEAADATDKMTAALRGFNMEINEASAQRVNDVYSNLAAKTASNTEELGTAMQRTASIAASAGMSFEGTAAFLAQAIETTREPAENLGTAMKTIVARFTELKKNPLEITEVDGEEVSYNKIDTALQSIGVSLKDTNGQFRDLDQVFLDISQRWDSLSQTQQRYIATTAAGSRQQSRFIAMMSNYERTMQLMDYANNSAGASEEQFGKTMESLEAKLNKLHNAWQQFTMGIANNNFVKGAVDGLTGFLNITNKVIDKLSLGSGVIKSFLSIFAAFTGLKATGKIANSLIGGLGGLVDPTSTFGTGFRRGMVGNQQAGNAILASQIYSPIVNAIYDTSNKEQAINAQQKLKEGAYSQYNSFKELNNNLRKITGQEANYSVHDVIRELNKTNPIQQKQLMKGLSGTELTLTNNLLKRYKTDNTSAYRGILQTKSALRGLRNNGNLSYADYFEALFDPRELKKYIDTSSATGKAAQAYLDGISEQIKKRSTTALDDMYSDYEQQVRNDMEGELEEDILDVLQTKEEFKKDKDNQREAENRAIREVLGTEEGKNNTKITKALDSVGKAGASISQFGMAVQGFSSLLMNSANPALQTFGSLLSSVGSGIVSFGMGISGLASTFSTVAESNLMMSIFGESAATATGGLFLLAAAITAVVGAIKIYHNKIKKNAEEITTKYKERTEKNQANIANLKQWREELSVLSQGVDNNGLNISLSPSDYSRYQEITDSIAEINPEIVKGYNAQGHAIIENNKALEATLALEQQRSHEIVKNYTDTKAWTDLLKARRLSRTASQYSTKQDESIGIKTNGYELIPKVDMRRQAAAIGQQLKKNRNLINLSDFGIDIDELATGSGESFDAFLQNFDKVKNRINNAIDNAGNEWSTHSANAIADGFSKFSESASELNDLVKPLYESMSVYASQSGLSDFINDNLKTSFQQVLKTLAEDANIDSEDAMRKAVDNTINEFSRLDSEYESIMDKVDAAHEKFANSFNETEYQTNINAPDGPIADLQQLKQEFEDIPGGSALSQWIDNEIAKIKDHTSDGVETIASAWNTLSDEISIAENAFEDFSKQVEKDYSTAADNMKQIYDAAAAETDDIATHMEGLGDNTYWTAAENLFGDVSNKSKKEVDKMFKDIEPMLKEGQEGFDNFFDRVVDTYNNGGFKDIKEGLEFEDGFFKSIDDSANPEVWQQVAEALGISENLLVSMLNKGRQFLGIDFTNYPELRKTLANDTNTLKGKDQIEYGSGKNATTGQALYITQDELRDYMGAAAYNDKKKREAKTSELESQAGVKVLKAVDELTKIDLKDAFGKEAISSIPNLIDKLGAKYNEEDLKTIAQNVFGDKFNPDEWRDSYKDYLDNQDYPTLQPIQSIESLVSQIASAVTKNAVEGGNLTSDIAQSGSFKDLIFGEAGIRDTVAQRFSVGKDVNGEKLNDYTYRKSLQELETLKAGAEEYKTSLQTGLENNKNLSKEQRELYTKELGNMEQYIAKLDQYISEGKEYKPEKEDTTSREPVEEGKRTTGGSGNDSHSAEQSREIQTELSNAVADFLKRLFSGTNVGSTDYTSHKEGVEKTTNSGNELPAADKAAANFIENLNTGSESLVDAGTNLNTAATNLSAAAILISKNDNPSNSIPNLDGNTNIKQPQQQTVDDANASIIIDTASATQALDNLKVKVDEVKDDIEDQVTFGINVSGLSDLQSASKNAKTISKATGNHNISLTTTTNGASSSSIDTLKQSVENFNKLKNHTVTLTTSLKGASVGSIETIIAAINAFHLKTDHTVTLKTIKETIEKPKAAGVHNHGYVSPPSFGSVARGSYGQIGPKGKGGLTLTGELGYEIAWLPDENRSIILGANGPQMVNLPGNAVVWSHEQSKKIVSQKSIHAGSATTGTTNVSGVDEYLKNRNKGGSNKSNKSNKSNNNVSKQNKKNADNAEKVIKKAGKINGWWWNMTKKVEATQRRIDKAAKDIQKLLKTVGKTFSDIKGDVTKYIKDLKQQITLNTRMSNKATSKLKTLDKGDSKTNNKVKSLNKKLAKAKRKGDKKQVKKLKKQIKNAKKGVNYSTVSYEVTKKKNGKKTKETKKTKINLAPYIYYDKATGTYQVDYNKINSKDWSKSKKKAVMEAAQKKVEDYQNKKNTADDNIEKANEALEQLGQDLYDTFLGWEIELTKIWNITQQIEETASRIERVTSYIDLMDAQIASGMAEVTSNFLNEYMDAFRKKLTAQQQQIRQQMKSIDIYKLELADLNNVNARSEAISNYTKTTEATANITEEIDKAQVKYDNKSDTLASKKSAMDAAKAERDAVRKKYGKNSSQYKKANEKYNKAKDAYNKAKEAASKAKTNLKDLQDDYTSGIESGKYYDESDQLLYQQELKELEADRTARAKAHEFAKITTNSDGTLSVDFDTEAFIAARNAGQINSETASRIQEYVKSLVETTTDLNNAYTEVTELIESQYTALAELKENWASYGEQLLSYIEDRQAKEINRIKTLADSIDKSLQNLLDRVKKDLDRRRQQEDNAKTEQNISKKQQRLAALRANTGGGNQVEIAKLQQEIAEAQQDYQRTLEDQLLERLNDQADLAAKQRERQIQIQEAIYQATNNAAEVNKWMDDPERYKNEIQQAFYDNNKYHELTAAQQAKLDDDFNTLFTNISTNQQQQRYIELAIKDNYTILEQIQRSLASFASSLDMSQDIEEQKSLKTVQQLKDEGYSLREIIQYNRDNDAGFTASEYNNAGFTLEQFKESGGLAKEALLAQFLGSEIQKVYKLSAEQLQSIRNDYEEFITQKNALGHTTSSVTKSNGKTETGELNTSGTKVAAAKGSTIETYEWDSETGTQGKSIQSIKITGFTDKTLNAYPKEAKEAMKYAIAHSNIGSKLNDNWGALASAAGLIGGSYTLKGGQFAQMTSEGRIYYVSGSGKNSVVRIWDPSKGTDKEYAYDKNKYIEAAKNNKYNPEVYKRVLNARGVKYATGGLADYTGPAWLDGTPAKPELVLNATDTKNFIALKDVLSNVLKSTGSINSSTPYNTYEININVDHLNNDYDVDKVAERVKRIIVKESSYRNVTRATRMR